MLSLVFSCSIKIAIVVFRMKNSIREEAEGSGMRRIGKAWILVAVLVGILAIGAMGKRDFALLGIALLCPLSHLLFHGRHTGHGDRSDHNHRISSHN